MRCLYCGKELALLKRWTGGGEFCSDAHRQRYQEEYNQLALNRLLQAKPPAKRVNDAPPAKPSVAESIAETPAPAATSSAPRLREPATQKISEAPRAKPAYEEVPLPAPAAIQAAPAKPASVRAAVIKEEIPVVSAPEPVELLPPPPPEVTAPAETAGFLVERPVAVLAEVAPMSRPDMEFLAGLAAALPNHSFEPLNSERNNYQLGTAGLLTFQPSNRASNYSANGTRERRLEVRDFVRTSPVVEIDLTPAGETGLETASEAMDILMIPQPPQGLPIPWQQPPLGFSTATTELGDLARLSFTTTGFTGEEESKEDESPHRTAVALAELPAPETIVKKPAVAPEVFTEPVVEAILRTSPVPEPQPISIQAEVVEQVVEPVPEPVVVAPAPPVPEPSTKPLPLTLQATAPGKGKTVQVFSSAPNAVAVQVPRSSSLPLRATMTIGPAPVAAPAPAPTNVKIEAKSEPRKPVPAPAPVRPDPRVAAAKSQAEVQDVKKPAVKAPEPIKQVAKVDVPSTPKPPAKVDAKQDKKPEVRENVKSKEEVKPPFRAESLRPEPVLPAPLAAPYPGSNDLGLGLPRLNLQPSPGLLGQIPMVARIVIVVILLAGLGGLIAFSSKSGGAAVSDHAGQIVAGSAVPSGGDSWITDWGADPGVRRSRQISILRSSQTLTDYRLEMQAQIETKAIGWVFRAQDPKNFYVTKLEIVKPGLDPTIALVRFAVLNGEEQVHAQLPLPMKVRRDTLFKIRFDAVGSHFTTFVQDQKVDDWADDRVRTGGVGLYSERGEVANLKGGLNVVPLMIRK